MSIINLETYSSEAAILLPPRDFYSWLHIEQVYYHKMSIINLETYRSEAAILLPPRDTNRRT